MVNISCFYCACVLNGLPGCPKEMEIMDERRIKTAMFVIFPLYLLHSNLYLQTEPHPVLQKIGRCSKQIRPISEEKTRFLYLSQFGSLLKETK